MSQKARSGGTPGRAPIGYLNVRAMENGREKRTVIVDEQRAPLISWAFEAYATGEWTVESLGKELTRKGLRTVPTARMNEGGINAMIKQTLRLHRGMSEAHQKRAAEWVLIERAGLLGHAHTFAVHTPIGKPQKQRPRFTEPDPGPVLYDTGLSADEGLWLRHEWAGRG